MIVKWRSKLSGKYVWSKIYTSKEPDQTFEACGELTLTLSEWQSITAALLLGASQMDGNLVIEIDDHDVVPKL